MTGGSGLTVNEHSLGIESIPLTVCKALIVLLPGAQGGLGANVQLVPVPVGVNFPGTGRLAASRIFGGSNGHTSVQVMT